MSKKKGFRTALATILVVLVIFAALTFAAIKYFLPMYQISQSEVFSWAVKIYPLIIGITLIVIASMLGKDDNEEEGEEDKLPPNAYEQQLFEKPADDPGKKASQPVATPVAPVQQPEEAQFVSIFDQEPAETVIEKTAEPETENPEIEALAEEAEPEEEYEPATEPVVEVTPEEPIEPKEDPNKPLVEAIMALVDKMDDFTTAVIYGSEEDEDEDYEEEEEELEEVPEEEQEETEESENDYEEHFARLESKLNSLADIVEKLADDVKNAAAPVVVAEPAVEPEPVEETETEEVEEPEVEESSEEAEIEEESTTEEEPAEPAVEEAEKVTLAPGSIVVDASAAQSFKEYEGSAAKQAAMAEFDSAKDFGYDLNVALVAAPLADVTLNLGDAGQCIENGDKTIVVIPFASESEAKDTLDKLDIPYELRSMAAGSDQSFDDLAKDWIN